METGAPVSILRRLDHVVMPVPSLEQARAFFQALGFTVAPDAKHPFGTENACVFLADGAYFEPLAVDQREVCEAEARLQNPFVARDQAHRFRIGTPSFSGVALSSDDATGDAEAFRQAGYGTGELFEFARPFTTADGTATELRFRLGFAHDRRAPDVSFFTCEKRHRVAPDRTHLMRHPNGATGIARLVFGEQNPTDFQYFLQEVTGDREMEASSFAMNLSLAGSRIEVATPESLKVRYGISRDERRGLSFEGVVVSVGSLSELRAAMDPSLGFAQTGEGVIVQLSDGPFGFIAFEETRP